MKCWFSVSNKRHFGYWREKAKILSAKSASNAGDATKLLRRDWPISIPAKLATSRAPAVAIGPPLRYFNHFKSPPVLGDATTVREVAFESLGISRVVLLCQEWISRVMWRSNCSKYAYEIHYYLSVVHDRQFRDFGTYWRSSAFRLLRFGGEELESIGIILCTNYWFSFSPRCIGRWLPLGNYYVRNLTTLISSFYNFWSK